MDVLRSNVLKEWSAWMYQLQVLVQYVAVVREDSLEMD